VRLKWDLAHLQFVPIRAARVMTAKHERNALAQATGAGFWQKDILDKNTN
jgi:hypothetical protein